MRVKLPENERGLKEIRYPAKHGNKTKGKREQEKTSNKFDNLFNLQYIAL